MLPRPDRRAQPQCRKDDGPEFQDPRIIAMTREGQIYSKCLDHLCRAVAENDDPFGEDGVRKGLGVVGARLRVGRLRKFSGSDGSTKRTSTPNCFQGL